MELECRRKGKKASSKAFLLHGSSMSHGLTCESARSWDSSVGLFFNVPHVPVMVSVIGADQGTEVPSP